jgi:hypothetical protein
VQGFGQTGLRRKERSAGEKKTEQSIDKQVKIAARGTAATTHLHTILPAHRRHSPASRHGILADFGAVLHDILKNKQLEDCGMIACKN